MNTKTLVTVDFSKLSQWGLIAKINHDILHPLGLSLSYDVNSGVSEGCLVAPDLYFESPKDLLKEHNKRYEDFLRDRYAILTEILGIKEEKDEDGDKEGTHEDSSADCVL